MNRGQLAPAVTSELREQGALLNQQLRLLVTSEKRLFKEQHLLRSQVSRLRALNDFALSAPQSYSQAEILLQAIELLWAHFPVQVMIAYFSDGDRGAEVAWLRTEDDDTVQVPLPAGVPALLPLEVLNSSQIYPGGQGGTTVPPGGSTPAAGSPLAALLAWLAQVAAPSDQQPGSQPPCRRTDVVLPFGAADVDCPRAVIVFRSSTVGYHDAPVVEADRPFLDRLCRHAASAMEMAALRTALERRISQRTRELSEANEQLEASLRQQKHAQDQLIQAGKLAAVGTLVAGLSHELNNPVGIILGYVQSLIKRTPDGAPQKQALAAIERQAQRCGALLRNLLDFARQDPGSRTAMQPVHLLEKVMELAAGQARRRDLQLELVAGGRDIPQVVVNVQELESALLNLVTNSIDATPAGGRITLAATRATIEPLEGQPEVAAVRLTVADSGSGIPEELLSRVFDPFFTTKPPGQGTGLGLSLSRQIVEAHGGRMVVETRLGQGTTIHVLLPLSVRAAGGGPARGPA
jgi:signal transduction histidine kinase